MDDLKYFIDNRCGDTINKNKFCEILINKYFVSNKETSDEIIQLIKQLVKLHVLFKSNYSRGLLIIYNNWEEISMDYDTSNSKIKLLLSTLRSVGITKGLEHLLEKYQVINKGHRKYLDENEEKMGKLYEMIIDIDELSDELILYSLYDVVYLKYLYKRMI
jgi:hypothetical protein